MYSQKVARYYCTELRGCTNRNVDPQFDDVYDDNRTDAQTQTSICLINRHRKTDIKLLSRIMEKGGDFFKESSP